MATEIVLRDITHNFSKFINKIWLIVCMLLRVSKYHLAYCNSMRRKITEIDTQIANNSWFHDKGIYVLFIHVCITSNSHFLLFLHYC